MLFVFCVDMPRSLDKRMQNPARLGAPLST
jgi:hypothetical protein